jgi:hypothetical protein
VLYSRNKFQLVNSGWAHWTLDHFCDLLAAPHLAFITDLSLEWDAHVHWDFELHENNRLYGNLSRTLKHLRRKFLGLRQLKISTTCLELRARVEGRGKAIYGAADEFVLSSAGSRLEQLCVALPGTLYRHLEERQSQRAEDGCVRPSDREEQRFWKPVDGASELPLKGYWVSMSWDDETWVYYDDEYMAIGHM